MGFENYGEGHKNEWRNCDECRGTGKVDGEECETCDGSGKVRDD